MATRVSTHSSVGTFHLWNSFLLVQMVIKIDFSSSILFFRKQEISLKQIILIIAPFTSQWWSWNILHPNNWVIRCFIVCVVFLSFIWSLNISDSVLQITGSIMLIKPLIVRKRRSYSTHKGESPFTSVLAFANLLDPVFDIIFLYNLC